MGDNIFPLFVLELACYVTINHVRFREDPWKLVQGVFNSITNTAHWHAIWW